MSFEVNIKGVYLVNRALIPLMLQGDEKTIIAVRLHGAHNPIPSGCAYQAAKQAVLRMNNFLVADYGEQGLLAYSVYLGTVATEIALHIPGNMHQRPGQNWRPMLLCS